MHISSRLKPFSAFHSVAVRGKKLNTDAFLISWNFDREITQPISLEKRKYFSQLRGTSSKLMPIKYKEIGLILNASKFSKRINKCMKIVLHT